MQNGKLSFNVLTNGVYSDNREDKVKAGVSAACWKMKIKWNHFKILSREIESIVLSCKLIWSSKYIPRDI